MRVPLAIPAALVIIGVLIEREQSRVVFAALAVVAIVALCTRRSAATRTAVVALAVGVLCGAHHGHVPMIEREVDSVRISGSVTSDVRDEVWGSSFDLRVDNGKMYSVSLRAGGAAIFPGDMAVIEGRLEPFDVPRNPGEPSPREMARERGLVGRINGARIVRRHDADPRDWHTWPCRARAVADARLAKFLNTRDAALLAGALYGSRGRLDSTLRQEFADTGTVHVLVTAGLHLGVVAALCLGLFALVRCDRIAASIATIPVVWLYAALSGGHLPSLRAASMITVVLTARALGERSISLNTIAIAAIVIATAWPASVGGVSFGLSFSCIVAIALFAAPIAQKLETLRLPSIVREPIALTVATQLGVWPLTLATFNTISPYAIVANVLVVPVVGIAMFGGAILVVISPFVVAASAAAQVEHLVLSWIVAVVDRVAAFPHASIVATPPPMWTITLYDLAMFAVAAFVARKRWRHGAIIGVAACLLVVMPPREMRVGLRITFIDVGQGDAALIETPRGHAILIDAGGRLERGTSGGGGSPAQHSAGSPAERVGERTVVPFILRSGIHHLDALIISHPHGDHIGGGAPILRALGSDVIFDTAQSYGGPAYADFLVEAKRHHITMISPQQRMTWHTDDGVTFEMFPPATHLRGRDEINENSLVVRVACICGRPKPFHALFMGDAGQSAETALLAQRFDLHSDVLKVGHHGSRFSTSSEFLAAVHPAIAVISDGRHNVYHHPAPTTLQRLSDASVATYRTDLCGAVIIDATLEMTIRRCWISVML